MKRTAIIFALFWEMMPFARKMGVPLFKAMSRHIILEDRNIALIRCGMGKEKASEAAERMIREFRPEAIVSAGFCGALVEELKVGDVVVSDFEDGKLFCSDRILFTYDEKAAARRQHSNAMIVDMESAAVYSAAKKSDIPFIAIKSVSDSLRDELPKSFFTLGSMLRLKDSADIAAGRLSDFLFEYVHKEK